MKVSNSKNHKDPGLNFQNKFLLFIFFISGAAGLIYEVAWARLLGLAFGTSVASVTVVLVAYMAGLGLGGLYFGRRADRSADPRRLFAVLELGIGLAALLVALILSRLPGIYRSLYWLLTGKSAVSLFLAFVLAALVLFVPTFFMGGTLPAIVKAYLGRQNGLGEGVGRLYGFNTLGGVLGAVLAGYYFIPVLGINAALLSAVFLNLSLAFLGWFMKPARAAEKDLKPAPSEIAAVPARLRSWTLIIAAAAGLTGMACEILWFRGLSTYLTNSTYSITAILAVFLAGLGLGGWLFGRFAARIKSPVLLLARIEIVIGLSALFTGAFFSRLSGILFTLAGWMGNPWVRVFLPGLILGLIVMALPAVFMGVNFPLLVRIYNHDPTRVGTGIGRLFFLNTLGSMAGPVITTFLLIPGLGVVKGIALVSLVNLFLGTGTLFFCQPSPARRRFAALQLPIYALAVIFAVIGARESRLLPPSLFRAANRRDQVLYYRETAAGTVVASEDRLTGIRACYVNNSAVCGTTYDALKVVKMLGHLPFLVDPASREVLVVGFGIGITTACLAGHGPERIDCAEICPGVRSAAQFFSDFNRYVYRSPTVHFFPGDGRNILLLSRKKYDIISCDPTHPTLGCGNLYTREYFQLYRDHLNRGGVVSQYLPLHKLSPEEFRSLVRTFASVFPHTTVWLGHSHGILLGTDHELKLDFKALREFLVRTGDDILDDPYQMATALILDEKGVEEFSRGAGLHTDNRPFLEFFNPISLKGENWEWNLRQLLAHQSDPAQTIAGIPADTLARYRLGQKYFLAGLARKSQGDTRGAIAEYEKGRAVNPENREIRIFLENEIRQARYFQNREK